MLVNILNIKQVTTEEEIFKHQQNCVCLYENKDNIIEAYFCTKIRVDDSFMTFEVQAKGKSKNKALKNLIKASKKLESRFNNKLYGLRK